MESGVCVCVWVCEWTRRRVCRRNLREMRGSNRKLERKRGRDFWSAAVMRCCLKGIIGSLTTKCALRPECRDKTQPLNWADRQQAWQTETHIHLKKYTTHTHTH